MNRQEQSLPKTRTSAPTRPDTRLPVADSDSAVNVLGSLHADIEDVEKQQTAQRHIRAQQARFGLD